MIDGEGKNLWEILHKKEILFATNIELELNIIWALIFSLIHQKFPSLYIHKDLAFDTSWIEINFHIKVSKLCVPSIIFHHILSKHPIQRKAPAIIKRKYHVPNRFLYIPGSKRSVGCNVFMRFTIFTHFVCDTVDINMFSFHENWRQECFLGRKLTFAMFFELRFKI